MSRDYTFAFGANPSNNTGLAPTFIFFVNSAGATITPPAITELLASSGLYKASYNATQMISFILDGATTALSSSDRYITGVFDPADKFASTLTGMGSTLGGMGTTLAGMGNTLFAAGSTLTQIGTNLTNQGATLVAQGSTLSSIATTTTGLGTTLTALNVNVTNNATYIANAGATLVATGATLSAVAATLATMSELMGSTQSSFGSTNVDPLTLFGYMRRLQEIAEGNQVYTKATGLFALYSRGSGTTTMLRQLTVTDNVTSTTRE